MQIAFAIAMAPQLGALAISTVWSYVQDTFDLQQNAEEDVEDQSLITPETEKVQIEDDEADSQLAEVQVLEGDNEEVKEEKSGPVCLEKGAESTCEASCGERPTEEECIIDEVETEELVTSCVEAQDSLSADTDDEGSFPLTESEIRQLAEENARYFADCHTNWHRPRRPQTPEIKPGVEPVYHAAFCSIIVDCTHDLFIEAATHHGLLGNNINSIMNNENCRNRAKTPSWLVPGNTGRQQTTLWTIARMVAEKVVTTVTAGDQEEIEDDANLTMILHYKTEFAVKNVYNKSY